MFNGITFVGIHFGNGTGSPGNTDDGDATAFYRFNAGTNLDQFFITTYTASSNAVLYRTGASAVPEPATWAMMLIGFGAAGMSLRRRPRPAFQAA